MNDLTKWVPAKSRTYRVPIIEPGCSQVRINLAEKASVDCIDYAIDFSQWLDDPNDQISSYDCEVLNLSSDQYDLEIVQSKLFGNCILFMVASGHPGMQHVISVQITTEFGRIFLQQFFLCVSTFSPAAAYPFAIFPADVSWNGGILMAGSKPLPIGYFSNGGVVGDTAATDTQGAGTPHFSTVRADEYENLPGDLGEIGKLDGAADIIGALLKQDGLADALADIVKVSKSVDLLSAMSELPSGGSTKFAVDGGSVEEFPNGVSDLPDGIVPVGGLYSAEAGTVLPSGLSLDGGIVRTDGTVFYRNTKILNGLLASADA